MNLQKLNIFAFLAALACVCLIGTQAAPQSNTGQKGDTAEAQQVYKAKCQMCHAPDGSGNTPAGKKLGAKDLKSDEVQKHSDAELFTIIAKGKDKMPKFTGKLTDQQILALVADIRQMGRK